VISSASGGGSSQNVSWTNAAGVAPAGNNLTKTAGEGWGNGGAASIQTIASGDGYVEFTVGESGTYRMCGLSNGDSDQNYPDIDFAVYLAAGGLYVFEDGTNRGYFGSYTTVDVFRVAVEGGAVKYKKNGSVFYTSTVAPSYPLLVDTSLYSNGSTLTNVVISSGGSSSASIHYLVSDQLGTPRMIYDQSGSLASMSRHDYLPFGEELVTGQGLRTTAQGYSANDSVRQKFTGYEADPENGLNYAHARSQSNMQGRFTSPDDLLNDTNAIDPASWNLYAYVRNNPLRYDDPSGEKIYVGGLSQTDLADLLQRLNYTYGNCNCAGVDKDGYLTVDTSSLSKNLANATQFLTEAINSTIYFAEVQVSNDDRAVAFGENRRSQGSVTFQGRLTNADLIVLDFADDKQVSGDNDAKKAFLNTVFAHEVAHGYLGLQDPAEGERWKTGPVVDIINKVTDALGVPRRDEYFSRDGAAFWFSTHFSKLELKNGKPAVDKHGNPKMKDVYVNWLKRNVGGKGIN
jgi:RHS repeat-associated protein